MTAWPASEGEWFQHAADLRCRVALQQVHVEPSWLYSVCTSCGWELEAERHAQPEFRFAVANHRCAAPLDPWAAPAAVQGDNPRPGLW